MCNLSFSLLIILIYIILQILVALLHLKIFPILVLFFVYKLKFFSLFFEPNQIKINTKFRFDICFGFKGCLNFCKTQLSCPEPAYKQN